MQYDDTNFQAEFVDFLRDSYRGRSGKHDVWDYLGMDEGAFRRAYAAWVGEK